MIRSMIRSIEYTIPASNQCQAYYSTKQLASRQKFFKLSFKTLETVERFSHYSK